MSDERLQRMEEAQAFTERAVEELSETVLDAFDRIDALVRRIAALEARLEQVEIDGEAEEGED